MADAKYEPNKPIPAVNVMDRAEHDQLQAAKAKADKEAAEKAAKEPAPPPSPTQEEADAMKQVAAGEIPPAGTLPEGTPASSKREVKAEPQPGEAGYKTR